MKKSFINYIKIKYLEGNKNQFNFLPLRPLLHFISTNLSNIYLLVICLNLSLSILNKQK